MVSEISSAKRAEIKSKSVKGLPNTVTGKPDIVKNAIFDPVDIVVGEVNRIVGDTNDELTKCKNDITENGRLIEKNKTDIQTNKASIEKSKTELTDKITATKSELEKNIEKNRSELANSINSTKGELEQICAKKEEWTVLYDRNSSDSKLNKGYPNGVPNNTWLNLGHAAHDYKLYKISGELKNTARFMTYIDTRSCGNGLDSTVVACDVREGIDFFLVGQVNIDALTQKIILWKIYSIFGHVANSERGNIFRIEGVK